MPPRSTRPRRSSAARPPTSAVMARELGLPGAARLRDHDRDLPDVPGAAAGRPASTTSSGRGWPRSRRPSGAASATRRTRSSSASGPARPVSMPGMMDTILNLGPERRDDGGPGPRRRAATAFAAQLSRALRRELPRRSSASTTSRRTPGCSCALAIEAVFRSWNSDRARGLPREGGDPRRPRHGGHRPGDGLRQPRRDLGDRRPLHAQPGDRRADPLRRRHVRRPGRGRRRRHASDRADRRPRRADAGGRRRAARLRRRAGAPLRATCATSSSPSSRAGSGCSSAGSASAARRPPCGSPSTWPRTRTFPLVARARPSSAWPRSSPIRRRRPSGRGSLRPAAGDRPAGVARAWPAARS